MRWIVRLRLVDDDGEWLRLIGPRLVDDDNTVVDDDTVDKVAKIRLMKIVVPPLEM